MNKEITEDMNKEITPVYLGDWVQTQHGRHGRVSAIHHVCPENHAWIKGQSIPVTKEQKTGRWASVLVDGGGSVVQPVSTLVVIDQDRGRLDNAYASVFFRDSAAWMK